MESVATIFHSFASSAFDVNVGIPATETNEVATTYDVPTSSWSRPFTASVALLPNVSFFRAPSETPAAISFARTVHALLMVGVMFAQMNGQPSRGGRESVAPPFDATNVPGSKETRAKQSANDCPSGPNAPLFLTVQSGTLFGRAQYETLCATNAPPSTTISAVFVKPYP